MEATHRVGDTVEAGGQASKLEELQTIRSRSEEVSYLEPHDES